MDTSSEFLPNQLGAGLQILIISLDMGKII
jgi:hypothetical protein